MKIWLVGQGGMLASAFEDLFKRRGISCVATSEKDLDILDVAALRSFASRTPFSHLINCAAYTSVDTAEREPEKAFAVNVTGTENLAGVCRENRSHMLHFSTDYIFDGVKKTPYSETDEPRPLSVYGKTKWEGERRLMSILGDATVVRTSWLFGQGKKNFVMTMKDLMHGKDELNIVHDQVGRPTYAPDLAEAAFDLMGRGGIFHFAGAGAVSWYEFAEEIKEQLGASPTLVPVTSEEFQTLAKRPTYSVLSTEKVESVLGLKPRPWKEGLREYLSII